MHVLHMESGSKVILIYLTFLLAGCKDAGSEAIKHSEIAVLTNSPRAEYFQCEIEKEDRNKLQTPVLQLANTKWKADYFENNTFYFKNLNGADKDFFYIEVPYAFDNSILDYSCNFRTQIQIDDDNFLFGSGVHGPVVQVDSRGDEFILKFCDTRLLYEVYDEKLLNTRFDAEFTFPKYKYLDAYEE